MKHQGQLSSINQFNSVSVKDSLWEYTFLENGDWVYKAISKKPVLIKEKIPFKASEGIEKTYESAYEKHLVSMVKSITKLLVR